MPETTASRRIQAANQAALQDLVRGLAAVALARHAAAAGYEDRQAAAAARDRIGDLLDARAERADTDTFAALRALRAAVAGHAARLSRNLPAVTTHAPAAVAPSLALAYDIYGDAARAGETAARNRLPRPGFVPARPIEVLG